MPKTAMHKVLVAFQKGGAGKTTFTREMAVAAELLGLGPVGMIDTDKQGTLTSWHNRRQFAAPRLARPALTGIHDQFLELAEAGCRLVFIDTPARDHAFLDEYLANVDYLVIPIRPTGEDLAAVDATVARADSAKVPYHFVMSQVRHRSQIATAIKLEVATIGRVSRDDVHLRDAYQRAFLDARGVLELDPPDVKATAEVEGNLRYLAKQLGLEPREMGAIHGAA